jgi:hypothetical protein
LPEGEENDELDTANLEEWSVVGKVFLQLEVELNQTVHGDCYRKGIDAHDPNMSPCGM